MRSSEDLIKLERLTPVTTKPILKGKRGKRGLDGVSFRFEDFTEDQLALLRGKDGDEGLPGKDFKFDNFTEDQLALLKGRDGNDGDNGKSFRYEDFTEDQIALLRGKDGKDFRFEDLTKEQRELLRGVRGYRGLRGLKGLKGDKGDKGDNADLPKVVKDIIVKEEETYTQLKIEYTQGRSKTFKISKRGDTVFVGGGGSTSVSATWVKDKFTLTNTDVTNGYIDLSNTPVTDSEFVYSNGLFEDCYTITGNRLDFTGAGFDAGDEITVKYQK